MSSKGNLVKAQHLEAAERKLRRLYAAAMNSHFGASDDKWDRAIRQGLIVLQLRKEQA